MGFRVADAVVATWDIRSTATGQSVRAGDLGVILKQIGTEPASFRVRFTVEGRSVVLDGLTQSDITREGPYLGDPLEADDPRSHGNDRSRSTR